MDPRMNPPLKTPMFLIKPEVKSKLDNPPVINFNKVKNRGNSRINFILLNLLIIKKVKARPTIKGDKIRKEERIEKNMD